MADAAFDTLKFARSLRERATLFQNAAEGFADASAGAMQGEVARHSDVRELELRLEARIEAAGTNTLQWVFGAIGFQTVPSLDGMVALARSMAH